MVTLITQILILQYITIHNALKSRSIRNKTKELSL